MREAAQFERLESFAGGAWGGDRLREEERTGKGMETIADVARI